MGIYNINGVSFGLTLAISFWLCAHVATLSNSATEREEDVPINQIVYLGSVEGKSYFFDNTTGMNWTDAKAFCNSSGLSLASVETPAEATFLGNAQSSNALPGSYYWTAGREARAWRMMSWDSSEGEILSEYVGHFYWELDDFRSIFLLCVRYDGYYDNFVVDECNLSRSILCETRSEQLRQNLNTKHVELKLT